MMLKKIISLLLLLTLLLQVLPVKQMGEILLSNQINEEIPHDAGAFKDAKKQVQLSDYLVAVSSNIVSHFLNNSRKFISYPSKIPCNYSLEILVPPPNVA